jgi:hypothetical protein
VTVQLRVSINLKALTIEDMLGKRKRLQVILQLFVKNASRYIIIEELLYLLDFEE